MRRYRILVPTLVMITGVVFGTVLAGPALQEAEISPLERLAFDTRADLELLADAVIGASDRPANWSFNNDSDSPTYIVDLWFDNEQLADVIFGRELRPENWFGANVARRELLARNVRHDLELGADGALEFGGRPTGWRGAAPRFSCGRTLQNLVGILDDVYGIQPQTDETTLDFCRTLGDEVDDRIVNLILGDPAAQQTVREGTLAVRGDLERLADELLGLHERPPEWIGNRDIDSPTLSGDTFLDQELLATMQLGGGQRPAGWIGVLSNAPAVIFRNLRHDLELLADETQGFGLRPTGWQGLDPLARCDPLVQDIALAVRMSFTGFVETLAPLAVNVCDQVAMEANEFYELIPPPEELPAAPLPDDGAPAAGSAPLPTAPPPDGGAPAEGVAPLPDGGAPAEGVAPLPDDGAPVEGVVPLPDDGAPVEVVVPLPDDGAPADGVAGPAAPDTRSAVEIVAGVDGEGVDAPQEIGDGPFVAESQFAFSYLDVGATQYMGVMPGGTPFRAWYRNFGASTMMFVSGPDFALYIDRRWTTMPQSTFVRLPTLEGVAPQTFCDAAWCEGPSPTPTPTGGGAIAQLVFLSTPPPPPSQQQLGDKIQVSWTNVRVTYVVDNVQAGSAQVALEICTEPTHLTCEPVMTIFDNNLGVSKPTLTQFNGLNVFEFPYGYTANLVIEGQTLVSPDVWLSDPSLRQ